MGRYSWGRLDYPAPARVVHGDWRFRPLPALNPGDSFLPYGNGRSYGDSCVNSGGTHVSCRQLNRLIAFDRERGLLRCEAGVTLDEILDLVEPAGWFLPVVPGTAYATVGGAVANDVHGKNHHHAGSFGCHVNSLELLRSDGARLRCSRQENAGLFAATIGGLGLTGLVVSAELELVRVPGPMLDSESLVFHSLAEFSALSEASHDWDYTVAWVDCHGKGERIGRGIFSRARHATGSGKRPRPLLPAVPFDPPVSLVNRWSVKLLNEVYFRHHARRTGLQRVHYRPFFFPLDGIGHWNRLYGRRGFFQHQCVVPHTDSEAAIAELLSIIADSGNGSFLVVLKAFGVRASPGLMSFPRPGLTLALDFANRGARTLDLLQRLDHVVLKCGGAVYPAKDARMSAAAFARFYSRLDEFRPHLDPGFSSSFWRRVHA